jgi:hypothetical protein
MTTDPNRCALDEARAVADTMLYEGYVLYPYRASAQKNRERFQFGVLVPPVYTKIDSSEHSFSRTECLLECGDDAVLGFHVRFLQLQRRTRSGAAAWDEADQHEHEFAVPVRALEQGPASFPIHADAGASAQGTTERRREALDAVLSVAGERVAGPFRALRLSARLENRTAPPQGRQVTQRADALPFALVSAHLLVNAPGCAFVSMVDPPLWAAAEVAACRNEHTWPVLAGPPETAELLLSCPVILYDHPQLAPESPGDLYDATEIDEILTLRTLALTDAEKQEARATDPRAAALIDRVEDIPPELLDRLHGTVRYLKAVTEPHKAEPDERAPNERTDESAGPAEATESTGSTELTEPNREPWWDPGADASVSPETDQIVVRGVALHRGSRVLMRPGARRADAQDLFLAGRPATVEAVVEDVDGGVHLAVTPQDDPAAELHGRHGRYLYFAPDEVEPIGSAS